MKKFILGSLIFLFSITLSQNVFSDSLYWFSGSQCYEDYIEYKKYRNGSENPSWFSVGAFSGFVAAAARNWSRNHEIGFPTRTQHGQVALIFGKYLEDNPQLHHQDCVTIFDQAMDKAWGPEPLPLNSVTQ